MTARRTSKRASKKPKRTLIDDLDFDALVEEAYREAVASAKPRPADEKFDDWKRRLADLREEAGFDLGEPWGFSQYLLAMFGKNALVPFDRRDPLFDSTGSVVDWAAEMRGEPEVKRGLRAGYRHMMDTWLKTMAPNGIICARGLHSINAADHRDVMSFVYRGRGYSVLGEDSGEGRSSFTSYSMNLCVAVREFACRNGKVRSRGENPIVLVSRPKNSDIDGFGGDSESGDTNEAELHVKLCEPRCVERFFIASTSKIGKPVSADERRYYALDECVIVTGRPMEPYDTPKLRLHPDTPGLKGGRVVRNLPDGWKWYELA